MNIRVIDGKEMNDNIGLSEEDEEINVVSTSVASSATQLATVIPDQAERPSRTQLQGFSSAFPLVPEFIMRQVADYLEEKKIVIRQRQKFLLSICKYWSLKRAGRRGAPLLKRLHLEVIFIAF
jgi:hypothetical protein